MLHVAVEQCQAGDVLVVAPTSASENATSAISWPARWRRRSVLGLVIEASVRDLGLDIYDMRKTRAERGSSSGRTRPTAEKGRGVTGILGTDLVGSGVTRATPKSARFRQWLRIVHKAHARASCRCQN
jgi:hypothetical protein